jgi:galactose mutarotase-like enzyme
MDPILLERGNTRVTVAPEFGGRIAQFAVFDGAAWLPLLCEPQGKPSEQSDPLSWGCFAMVPWPNRIIGGRFQFEGNEYRLPQNDLAGALHGFGFAAPWKVDWRTSAAIGMSLNLGDLGWPWPARASQRIDVSGNEVRLSLELHAPAGVRFPAGCGWHPWFRRTLRDGDTDVCVQIDADDRLELSDMAPTGRRVSVEGPHDLRGYPEIGDRKLDDCYVGVRGPFRLRWGTVELMMRLSPNLTHAVVYTPPHAVCVEPQTCAIDAFNLDARGVAAGTAIVEAGRPLVATASWQWRAGT